MIDASAHAGPFRGPRSFQTGDTLYGRDREARALLATLIAERIVLLHSPSGAGKTSLVQAALVPALIEREFVVLPVVRVGAAPEPGVSGNRYLRSMLVALEEGLPAEERLPIAELDSLSLAGYLALRVPADADPVLIVDQFEEVLTRDPTDTAAKHAFFAELGAALRERRYRALFSMREDYVAALEPFLRHLPTRLSIHFRLDLLGVDGGHQALAEPVRQTGVTFPDELVAALIDDLRVVNVQQADGSITQQLGPGVEPVQLQILGLRLWSRLAPGATAIGANDVAALGDVGSALGDYYAEQVAAAASASGVQERVVRAWFDRELITTQGVRGQVLQGQKRSCGLENNAIRALIDAYLVRAEPRRGATWFELAHDRLIAPVRASNAAWEAASLSTLQRQADLWERQGRPAGLLLRGETLRDVETWAVANSSELTATDSDFLQLCRDARRQSRRVRNLAIGASILAVVASLAFVTALWLFNRAEQQRRLAVARELSAAADVNVAIDPERSLLLAMAAVDTTRGAGEPVTDEATRSLQRAVQAARVEQELNGPPEGLAAVAYSPSGATLAGAGYDGTLTLWNLVDGTTPIKLSGHSDQVYALDWSPDGTRLASAGADSQVILWDAAGAEQRRWSVGDGLVVTAVAWSPDGSLLATADDRGVASIWDVASGGVRLAITAVEDSSLDGVAWSPSGTRLATAGGDMVVRVWELADGLDTAEDVEPLLELAGPADALTSVAWSPDGASIAAASLDLRAFVWSADSGGLTAVLAGHAGSVYSIAFNAQGTMLATASADGSAKVWRLDTWRPVLNLVGRNAYVQDVAFSPDGGQLASAGRDGVARLWSLRFTPTDGASAISASPDGALLATVGAANVQLWDTAKGEPIAVLPGGDDGPAAVSWSPDGATLAIGDYAGGLRLWDARAAIEGLAAEPMLVLTGHDDAVGRLAWSPDSARLASASDDKKVRVWNAVSGEGLLLLDTFTREVYGLAWSPDGTRLAAADQDGLLIVYNAESGEERGRATAGAPLNALAWSPDGATLAAAGDDGQVRRYNPRGDQIDLLPHGSQISAVAYDQNGNLASAGLDGAIRLWAPTGAPLATLPTPAGVYAVAFLPEERLATVGADGVINMFPLHLDDLLAAARTRLTRGPRPEECAVYRLEGCGP